MEGHLATRRRPAAATIPYERATHSSTSAHTDLLARALVVFLALTPIPLGSHRPFFWAVNAVVLGVLSFWYVFALLRNREKPRYGPRRMWPTVTLFAILVIYMLIQVLPLGLLESDGAPIADWLSIKAIDGSQIVATSISLSPTSTIMMLMRWLTFGALFFLVAQVAGRSGRRNLLLSAILAIVTANALFGLASLLQFGDTLLGMAKWAYQGNATGTFVNRNSFATFLSLGAVVAVAMIMGSFVTQDGLDQRTRLRVDPIVFVYLVALAAIVATLLATQSRMGAFAGSLGILTVLLLARGRIKWRLRWDLGLVLFLLLVGAGGTYLYGQGLIERLGSSGASSDVRVDLYTQIVQMIMGRPLLGYGGGAFELAFPVFHRLPVSPDLIWDRAHNTYLALWSELGLVAGSLPMLMILFAAGRLTRGLKAARSDWVPRAAAIGGIVVVGIHSLSDFSLEIEANTFVFIVLLALGTVAASAARRRAN